MTEPSARAAARGPGMSRLALGSLALVAVVFALLAQRIAAGSDPVLSAARRPVPRQVIVKRIVKRTVVETTIRRPAKSSPVKVSEASSPITTSESGGYEPAAPVTRSS